MICDIEPKVALSKWAECDSRNVQYTVTIEVFVVSFVPRHMKALKRYVQMSNSR